MQHLSGSPFLILFLCSITGIHFLPNPIYAQFGDDPGQLHGDYQIDAAYYLEDSIIGTQEYPSTIGSNTYFHMVYTKGDFSAGARFEGYNPVLQGFQPEYEGNAIPYKFVRYQGDMVDVTAGNIYEQFGSGMVFRTYQEWNLGFDNSLYGVRAIIQPMEGIRAKVLTGRQRSFMQLTDGILRGGDIEFRLNSLVPGWKEKTWQWTVGGSAVSKFQEDNNPTKKLPENVMAWAARSGIIFGDFNIKGEFAYKYNDPSLANSFSYAYGSASLLNVAYSKRGIGANLTVKRIDNFDFRSDRNAVANDALINYLPPITPQLTYRLPTLYPYQTQPLGEQGLQLDVYYNIKRGTLIGGKYGTNLSFNYSLVRNIETQAVNTPAIRKSEWVSFGTSTNYQSIGLDVSRKMSRKFKLKAKYLFIEADQSALLTSLSGQISQLTSHIGIADLSYKIKSRMYLRTELQTLLTEEDYGDWITGLAELQYKKWFFAFINEYNVGNPDPSLRIHYPSLNAGYTTGTTRIALQAGRQRAGVLCVGGVCRQIPATSGLSLSVSGTF